MRTYSVPTVVIILTVSALFLSCDLERQTSFDFDEDAHWEAPEPFDVTVYDYINQEDQLSLMSQAIERANMEDTFQEGGSPESSDSNTITVFLLRNSAMQEFLDDYNYNSIDDVPVSTLENLLRYHVIPTRVKQRDVNVQTHTTFQTLVDGPDGIIDIWVHRDFWIMHINSAGAGFPDTKKSTDVIEHNYEFTNGIGHHIEGYTQRAPFE